MIDFIAHMGCIFAALATMQSVCILAEHPDLWGLALVLAVWFAMLTRQLYRWIKRRDRARQRTRLQVMQSAQRRRKEWESA